MYNGKSDATISTLKGLDFRVFYDLHLKFKYFFDKLTLHDKGRVIRPLQEALIRHRRKRILCSKVELALTLA